MRIRAFEGEKRDNNTFKFRHNRVSQITFSRNFHKQHVSTVAQLNLSDIWLTLMYSSHQQTSHVLMFVEHGESLEDPDDNGERAADRPENVQSQVPPLD